MTISTQLSLIREVRFSFRRPLAPIMHGAHKVLSEGFWSAEPGAKPHRPLWAAIVWKCRRFVPRRFWD
jgi:hypothetical protein